MFILKDAIIICIIFLINVTKKTFLKVLSGVVEQCTSWTSFWILAPYRCTLNSTTK